MENENVVPEHFSAACLPLCLSIISNGRHNPNKSQAWTQGQDFWAGASIVRSNRLQDEIYEKLPSFQTASMLALVLSCSFLFPSLDICRNASTP